MADRKQFSSVADPSARLAELLKKSSSERVSDEVLMEQRVSFAFGNAPVDSERITKDSVRHSSKHIRLRTV